MPLSTEFKQYLEQRQAFGPVIAGEEACFDDDKITYDRCQQLGDRQQLEYYILLLGNEHITALVKQGFLTYDTLVTIITNEERHQLLPALSNEHFRKHLESEETLAESKQKLVRKLEQVAEAPTPQKVKMCITANLMILETGYTLFTLKLASECNFLRMALHLQGIKAQDASADEDNLIARWQLLQLADAHKAFFKKAPDFLSELEANLHTIDFAVLAAITQCEHIPSLLHTKVIDRKFLFSAGPKINDFIAHLQDPNTRSLLALGVLTAQEVLQPDVNKFALRFNIPHVISAWSQFPAARRYMKETMLALVDQDDGCEQAEKFAWFLAQLNNPSSQRLLRNRVIKLQRLIDATDDADQRREYSALCQNEKDRDAVSKLFADDIKLTTPAGAQAACAGLINFFWQYQQPIAEARKHFSFPIFELLSLIKQQSSHAPATKSYANALAALIGLLNYLFKNAPQDDQRSPKYAIDQRNRQEDFCNLLVTIKSAETVSDINAYLQQSANKYWLGKTNFYIWQGSSEYKDIRDLLNPLIGAHDEVNYALRSAATEMLEALNNDNSISRAFKQCQRKDFSDILENGQIHISGFSLR